MNLKISYSIYDETFETMCTKHDMDVVCDTKMLRMASSVTTSTVREYQFALLALQEWNVPKISKSTFKKFTGKITN